MPKNRSQYEKQRAYRELRKQTLECTALFVQRALDALRDAERISDSLPGTERDQRVKRDLRFLIGATETATRIVTDYAQAVLIDSDKEEGAAA